MSGKEPAPHILLVNPWIHDFAAYDVWAKPYGLLSLGAVLKMHGIRVSYIDCQDRFHPQAPAPHPDHRHGRGPYFKTAIPRPRGLADIERTYSRYGIAPEWLREDLHALDPPDMIMVTSLMTYWYPGVFETIAELKRVFANVPLVLGGIYARLYPDHARRLSGADEVVVDDGASLFSLVRRHIGHDIRPLPKLDTLDALPYPALELQRRITYAPILTARGCPFRCVYCASHFLEPVVRRRSPDAVVAEIAHWHHNHGVVDFAFYDDALLVDADRHALPILQGIVQASLPIFLHTPNAVHIRAINAQVALAMKLAGMHTLRLGLETTAFEGRSGLDDKVTREEFLHAVSHLKAAGFDADQIGAYLLVGLPGQTTEAVAASIRVVKEAGARPVLAYYSPIPHTPLWPQAVAASRYDLASDPIFCNNAIFPCQSEAFSWQDLSRLKQWASQ